MSTADTEDGADTPEAPQQLVGFMNNDEWQELITYVDSLVAEMEKLPFPDVREKVFELLAGIDAIHREALYRLVRLFKEGVLEQVVTDPPIRTLMELYDLAPPAPQDEVAQQPGRKMNFPDIPVSVVYDAAPRKESTYPHWVPAACNRDDLDSGCVIEAVADDHAVLLCKVRDRLFAVAARCAIDDSSLGGATVSGYTLSCPNHGGCHYDIRQGSRIAGGKSIACFPVKTDDQGRVMVGLGMKFNPDLPTF